MILPLFAAMPLFQSRKESFKDCGFNSSPLLSWCLVEQIFLYLNVTRICIIMIVRIDVQYWALFATMPLFQSHKESFEDCGFQLLSVPDV